MKSKLKLKHPISHVSTVDIWSCSVLTMSECHQVCTTVRLRGYDGNFLLTYGKDSTNWFYIVS